jgi:hypothetical protein
MKTPRLDTPVHPKTLVEQKTDFTAEGSPPPGKVTGSVPPVTPDSVPAARTPKKRKSPPNPTGLTAERGTKPPVPKGPARPGKYG